MGRTASWTLAGNLISCFIQANHIFGASVARGANLTLNQNTAYPFTTNWAKIFKLSLGSTVLRYKQRIRDPRVSQRLWHKTPSTLLELKELKEDRWCQPICHYTLTNPSEVSLIKHWGLPTPSLLLPLKFEKRGALALSHPHPLGFREWGLPNLSHPTPLRLKKWGPFTLSHPPPLALRLKKLGHLALSHSPPLRLKRLGLPAFSYHSFLKIMPMQVLHRCGQACGS